MVSGSCSNARDERIKRERMNDTDSPTSRALPSRRRSWEKKAEPAVGIDEWVRDTQATCEFESLHGSIDPLDVYEEMDTIKDEES